MRTLIYVQLLLLPFFSWAQPANDACANATTLPCGTINLAGTTIGSVSETSPGACVGSYGVWYTFVGNGVSNTISATSPMDIGMRILSGSCGSFTGVTCQDGPAAGGTETYTFTPTNGVTYYVYIAYWSTGTTTNTFTISRTCVTPPVNDACSNATSLPCGTTNLAGTTVNAVSETAPGTCGMSGYGVWYTFTGNGSSNIISAVPGTTPGGATYDIGMAIYSGSCGSLTNVTCQDAVGASTTETYTFTPTNGVTYYVYIAYYTTGTTTGTFTISRSCPTPPANDACANATALPCGTTNLAGSTVSSALETAPGTCGMSGYGVWYSFTGNGSLNTISAVPGTTPGGATYDIGMAIYSGSCGSLTNVTCQDAVGASTTETYTFTPTNGTTYYVYIAYFEPGTTTGTFTISRSCPTPPANDACANATALPCETVNLAGSTIYSGSEVAPGTCGMSGYGVWYTFTGDGDVASLTLQGLGGYDTGLGVYSGSCASLTNIACEDAFDAADPETYSFTTTNGTNYYVYVAYFEPSTTTGNFQLSLTCPEPSAQDCPGALQICNDQNLSGNSNGFGVQELNSSNHGCFAGGVSDNEDQSSWYFFQATNNGTLEFIMNSNPGVDYDFIIWGPNKSCASLGSPIRCNASEVDQETGMVTINPDNGSTVTNTSSNPGATSTWIQSLPVQTGEVYIMVVNNFTANNTPFSIDWTFSVPNLLNCTPISLPVEFSDFSGYPMNNSNMLFWSTTSEFNNDYFTIERSADLKSWITIHEQSGALNSISRIDYAHTDPGFRKGMINYYRLSQTDRDGNRTELKTISIDNTSEGMRVVRRVNLLGQEVDENYRGVVILEFENGQSQKILQ